MLFLLPRKDSSLCKGSTQRTALYHLFVLPRLPFLHTARSRDHFLSMLELTRDRYGFVIVG